MSDGPSTRNMSDDGEDDLAAAVTVVFSALNDKIERKQHGPPANSDAAFQSRDS